jgi:NAD(P)-dependent dehydrogenase (short-subunit alcohol dehydrogenase family)
MARKKLQGQIAVITGGGRGIGKAAAEELAQLGATVVVTARSEEQVERVAAALRGQGGQAIGVPGDVADPEQVEAMIASILSQFGRIDILVNNAGVIWPVEDVAETDADEWTYNIQVNLLGPFYWVRNVLPLMIEQQYGRIVNVSSGAAINPIVGASAYSTAKAGLDMFTRALAQELSNTGVTVNSFHPGMVDTEMQVDLRSVDTSDASFSLNRFHDAYAQKQLRSPQDVARAIVWLAGPWSRDHNGEIFRIADEEWIRQVNTDLGV